MRGTPPGKAAVEFIATSVPRPFFLIRPISSSSLSFPNLFIVEICGVPGGSQTRSVLTRSLTDEK